MQTEVEKPLSEETIRRAVSEFQVTLDDEQVLCIQRYIRILLQWNDKLNLTAIRDPLEILHRHFCESMYAGIVLSIKEGRLADIGSGPGFPGIPLKILHPDLELFLVESNIKKGTFLAEVVREIGLSNTRVLIDRYEELNEQMVPLDYVCSRALGEFDKFLGWAASERVGAKNVVMWVGGRDLEEIQKIGGWEWTGPVPIPRSLRRFLLLGKNKALLSA